MGISGRTRPSAPAAEQLQDVVTQTHHGPLGIDGIDAAQGELAEAPGVLDVAVDGLNHGLAPSVPGSTLGGVEPPAHPLQGVESIGRVAGARGRSPIPMAHPFGRHPCFGAQCPCPPLDLGIPVPRIARRMLGRSSCVGSHPFEHRFEVRRVRGLVGHATGDDELMGFIDSKLRVVGLNEPVRALHDGAVRVGEVALCRVDRFALGRGQGGLSRQLPLRAGAARGVVARVELLGLRAAREVSPASRAMLARRATPVSRESEARRAMPLPSPSGPSLHSTCPMGARRTQDGRTTTRGWGASLPVWDATLQATDTEIR